MKTRVTLTIEEEAGCEKRVAYSEELYAVSSFPFFAAA